MLIVTGSPNISVKCTSGSYTTNISLISQDKVSISSSTISISTVITMLTTDQSFTRNIITNTKKNDLKMREINVYTLLIYYLLFSAINI